ncbi:TnsA endonuclease N-terminal domain-containing protein [Metapseudomonas otitidis]|uniref:TnsA endonuclease N-terminal domain-containing protein n=1 Tax=Metapseudomonas otitidis TaxID=319939 RepID=UPI003A85D372
MTPYIKDVSPYQFSRFLDELMEGLHMPVRKIGPSSYTNTGYIPSSKGSRVQRSESMLEQQFFTLLDYDRRVRGYQAQPFKIRWRAPNGRWRDYTPDVIVSYTEEAQAQEPWLKPTVYEVKTRKELSAKWSELRPKFRAAFAWARRYGCRFKIITDTEIRTPYLENVEHFMHYRCFRLGQQPDAGAKQLRILKALLEGQGDTPRAVLESIAVSMQDHAELIPWLWNLITQELVGADLSQPFDMFSPIWITDRGIGAIQVMQS